MTEVKVRLSMSVPGAQMLSSQECDKNPKKSYNVETIPVEFRTRKGKPQRENIEVKTRRSRLARQSLNISKEAYNYMIAADQPPTESLAKKLYIYKTVSKGKNGKPKKVKVETTVWAHQFNPTKRLDWHMARIAASLGAVDYQFEVLDDQYQPAT